MKIKLHKWRIRRFLTKMPPSLFLSPSRRPFEIMGQDFFKGVGLRVLEPAPYQGFLKDFVMIPECTKHNL
jgi:hypothetical protein